ncbi:Phosphatidate phosphatase PAH2 [Vitis vinifera]|uniref:phosphatidate phosphatase n=1 Tax=Vitis vinifera TaxID=29760 RepID=A0A438ITC8_VITVI|nr:Phosphatidate phosphatase PAH2 [Vitis vinifera]
MYAVERLSSYISRGVYTVSGPFHPFGGAVDIIVVEQQDGSFKSSPWYVRFGKFQGVLKTREKVVNISVNGVEANFHMYLDHKGEAFFLKEVDVEEGESMLYPSSLSSGDERDEESNDRRPMKSKSCNFDANGQKPVAPIDLSTGKIVPRTTSRRGRFLGLVFGRKSMKQESFREKESGADVTRVSSLERAEIAANLLEVRWTTSLATKKPKKDKASQISGEDRLDTEADNDGKSQTALCVNEDMENGSNPSQLQEENGFCDGEMSNNSQSGFHNSECSVGETGLEMSCLGTPVEISSLNETDLGETQELSEILRVINEVSVGDADHHDNVKSVTSSITGSESQIPQTVELEVSPCKQFNEEEAFDERDAVLSGHDVLEEENEQDGVQSFIYCETSGSSTVGLDDSIKETQEILYLACGGSGEVHVHDKTLHETSELISEVLEIIHQDTVTERLAEDIKSEAKKVPENHSQHGSPSYSCMPANGEAGLEQPLVMQESYTEMVIKSNVRKISGMKKKNSELQRSLESIGDSQEFDGDYVPTNVIRISPPESSDDEQFPFSDLDDFKHSEVRSLDLISLDPVEKENCPSLKLDSNEAVEDLFDANYVSYSSPDSSVQENPPNDLDNLIDKSRVVSSSISIPSSIKVTCEEVERLAESLPNMGPLGDDLDAHKLHHPISLSLDSNSKSLGWALLRNNISTLTKLNADNKHILVQEQPSLEDTQISRELINVLADPAVEISLCKHLLYEGMGAAAASQAFDAEKLDMDKFASLGPDVLKKDNLVVRISGHYFPWDAAAPIVLGMLSLGKEQILELKGMIAVDQVEKTLEGDPAKAIVTSGGSWRLWPFRRSRAISSVQPVINNTRQSDAENASEMTAGTDGNDNVCKPKLTKKKVDASIYLWKWNTRIVISDVDGTITKSDVLGQFMPMVGVDWSQTGVAHLFSAIKENGYQLLFLSARAISQAYHTRQFLFNLKQDGKALPDGPVVISPDGLFPSLFREVIRRAPHEFKIACLEDIKALFPSDCNPFYAGFGNRDTDEFSYLKVGIPKGKIFIINPKGEVAVNRRVDTKSYTSLHTLVNGMFPSTSSSEQRWTSFRVCLFWNYSGKSDFCSAWKFWGPLKFSKEHSALHSYSPSIVEGKIWFQVTGSNLRIDQQ